jgi:hypothetical protein
MANLLQKATVTALVTVRFSFDDESTVNSQDELAVARLEAATRVEAVHPRARNVVGYSYGGLGMPASVKATAAEFVGNTKIAGWRRPVFQGLSSWTFSPRKFMKNPHCRAGWRRAAFQALRLFGAHLNGMSTSA